MGLVSLASNKITLASRLASGHDAGMEESARTTNSVNEASDSSSAQSASAPAASSASRGGAARMGKLSAEARRALGRKAAEARWNKTEKPANTKLGKKAQSALAPTASSAPAAKPRPPLRQAAAPKAFREAHSYSEKRLAAALKERAQAMNKLAMLNAEIPSLVEIIKALQGGRNPQPAAAGALLAGGVFAPEAQLAPHGVPGDRSTVAGVTAQVAAALSRVQGGAGIPGIGDPVDLNDDEDRFLRESPVAGGEWH